MLVYVSVMCKSSVSGSKLENGQNLVASRNDGLHILPPIVIHIGRVWKASVVEPAIKVLLTVVSLGLDQREEFENFR